MQSNTNFYHLESLDQAFQNQLTRLIETIGLLDAKYLTNEQRHALKMELLNIASELGQLEKALKTTIKHSSIQNEVRISRLSHSLLELIYKHLDKGATEQQRQAMAKELNIKRNTPMALAR